VRRRLVVSTIAIVLVVMGALAAPVGLIVYRAAEDEVRARLDQQAAVIAAAVDPALASGEAPDADLLGGLLGLDDGVRITTAGGDVVFDRVPSQMAAPMSVTRRSSDGTVVVVFSSTDELDARFRRQVVILLVLAAGGLVAAAALAAIQARQLARPLERLASSAARLGEGDFSTKAVPVTGIAEIDDIATALRRSGERIDTMLSNERHFTGDATHQLRTGLTGLAMRFELLARHADEAVTSEAEAGLHQTEQLNDTIDELLALARERTSEHRTTFDLLGLVDDHVAEWAIRFGALRRRVVVHSAEVEPVIGTKGLAGQVVDVLLDNALVHGAGTVTVTVEGTSVTVSDEGPGFDGEAPSAVFDAPVDPAAPHGRGLRLARRLAEVDGGAVQIVAARPATIRFRLPKSDRAVLGA